MAETESSKKVYRVFLTSGQTLDVEADSMEDVLDSIRGRRIDRFCINDKAWEAIAEVRPGESLFIV